MFHRTQPKGFGGKAPKPTTQQSTTAKSYTTHITFSVHTDGGAFFVVTLNTGPPVSLESLNTPTFDDHLATALIGKEKFNIQADAEFLEALETAGFVYPFHNTYRRYPNFQDVIVKKEIQGGKLNIDRIGVKCFVFSLEDDTEREVKEWCEILTHLITTALKKADAARLQRGILKNTPQYSVFVDANNISINLSDGSYAPLDYALTDSDSSRYFEWTAKCMDKLFDQHGCPLDTVVLGAWQLTIYERHEELRGGFFSNWENKGYNALPVRTYGFPFSGLPNQKHLVGERLRNLITTFSSLDVIDGSQKNVKYAPFLVSSFLTLLQTTIPQAMTMSDYIQARCFKNETLPNSPHVVSFAQTLGEIDNEFQKYSLAFNDVASVKVEEADLKPAAKNEAEKTNTSDGNNSSEKNNAASSAENNKKEAPENSLENINSGSGGKKRILGKEKTTDKTATTKKNKTGSNIRRNVTIEPNK